MVKKTSDVQYYQLKSLESIETFLSFHGRNASSVQLENNVKSIVILKVVIKTPQPIGLSFASEVNRQITESSAVDHILNCCFHCSTETPLLHKTMAFFLTVQQAVTPTKLFPAPQGKTITPDLPRPLPNIFLNAYK